MKLPANKSKLIAAGVVFVAIVGGGASIAAASPSAPTPAGSSTSTGSQQENDPTITGTVKAPAGAEQADGSETAGSDAAEQAALKAVATVTADQAKQAALAAVAGTVGQIDLGNENGFVVYDVEVTDSNGTVTNVTIDAGNASVLGQQAEGAGETGSDGAGEGAETPDQPGSVSDGQG